MYIDSDQLLTARSHVSNLKSLSNRLLELENLFHDPRSDETWSVGTALGEVTSQLRSALSSFDALEISSEESLSVDSELTGSEETKRVDDACRELRESIMLVVQSLYKTRESERENQTEGQQTDSDEGNADSYHCFIFQ